MQSVSREQYALALCKQILLSCNATQQLGVLLKVHNRNAEGKPLTSWMGYLLERLCWDTACNLPLVLQLRV